MNGQTRARQLLHRFTPKDSIFYQLRLLETQCSHPTSAVFAVVPPIGAGPPPLPILLVGTALPDPLCPFGKFLCVLAVAPFVTITPSVCSIFSTLRKMWRRLPACSTASRQPLVVLAADFFDAVVRSAMNVYLISVSSIDSTRVCQVKRLHSDIYRPVYRESFICCSPSLSPSFIITPLSSGACLDSGLSFLSMLQT